MSSATWGRGMMIVATDYFIKWVEAEPMTTITLMDIEHFSWKNIICHFGIPDSIVTDNGSQFVGNDFAKFFKKYGIKQHISTPRYPQGNGQAEVFNKTMSRLSQEVIYRQKGQVARRTPRCSVGVSHHQETINR